MIKKAIIFVFAITISINTIQAQTPTKWRGPNGNGIYSETGLLTKWPANGPEILWAFDKLGKGYSSPVVANEQIYVSSMIENKGFVHAITFDGKEKWKASYGEEFYESYPGARSTPTIVDDLMYMYTGHGVLVCMSSIDGEIKWKKDGFNDFDGENIRWGVTETVVVDGDLVFMTPGGKKHNIVALNRFTGELVWSSPGKGELSAYCTPLLVKLQARNLLVTHTADHILGLDSKTGKMLWSYPQTNRWQVHANTPIFYDGDLFCFSGYGQGGVKLDLSADGTSVEKAWFSSNLDSRMGGMVVLDGYLYGSGDNNREWRCVDWNTGDEKYADKSVGKGVVISADGMLYCYSDRGELAMVEANPKSFKVIGNTKVELGSEQHWAHPIIHNGVLYLRHGDTLIAYKVK